MKTRKRTRNASLIRGKQSLRFTPTAWAKLRFLRDRGDTEIGGFGLSTADDLLLVEDVLIVRQRCTLATVVLDDVAVADLYDDLVDQGISPERFGRVWVHTHPGRCPLPSAVDEETFARVFGRNDWAVMAILARNDATYARLAFRAGPGGAVELPVAVDFGSAFAGAEPAVWDELYRQNVRAESAPLREELGMSFSERGSVGYELWEDFYGDAAESL